MSESAEPGKAIRPSLLTSKQATAAAIYGGLGFATRALGLVIPIVPPLLFDTRAIWLPIGAMIAGPWGLPIICLLHDIPSGVFLPGIAFSLARGYFFVAFYKPIYHMRSYTMQCLALIPVWAIANFLGDIMIVGGMALYGIVPFWPFLTLWYAGGGSEAYGIASYLTTILMLKYAKDYVKPAWTWRPWRAQA